jgi:uncharacterized protein YqjF (DUF2071 family)
VGASLPAPEHVPPAVAPHRVRMPVNVHHWERIAFLHWRVDPADVEPLLPDEVRVDVHDGWAWLGVTPFFMRVRPFGVPAAPPGWSFPETNVRTYVVGPDGRHGISFLRMEVTAGWFALGLRALGLPYVRQRMDVDVTGERVRYRSRPTEPGGAGGHDIVVQAGAPVAPGSGGPLEQFLTARWDAYHRVAGRLLRTSVEHDPWQLRHALVDHCEVGALFDAVGVPPPTDPPLAHISRGVVVRVAPPAIRFRSPSVG